MKSSCSKHLYCHSLRLGAELPEEGVSSYVGKAGDKNELIKDRVLRQLAHECQERCSLCASLPNTESAWSLTRDGRRLRTSGITCGASDVLTRGSSRKEGHIECRICVHIRLAEILRDGSLWLVMLNLVRMSSHRVTSKLLIPKLVE